MMWSRRQAWVTGSPIAFTCSSWSTSSAIEKALRPRFLPSFSTGSRCSSLRLQIATSAPARANSMAIDFPIPVPPPVTMAVLPSKENGLFAMTGDDTPRCKHRPPRSSAGFAGAIDVLGGGNDEHAPTCEECRKGGTAPLRVSLGQGDFRLLLRDLAFDASPDAHRRERRAVVLGAALELVHERARLVQTLARRLRRAAHVVVASPRG